MCLPPLCAERRLLMEGRLAPAVVTAHRNTIVARRDAPVDDIRVPADRRDCDGEMRARRSKPPAVGSVICVVYDSIV